MTAILAGMSHSGFAFVKKVRGISEHTLLKNGLRVLHRQDTSSPVVSLMVTYHVGSRNEAVGHTGATHLLEHLMFKGSKRFDKAGSRITDILERVGAKLNATTYLDRTNYYAVVPKEHADIVAGIEADRMRGAFIREKDRASEMTVVRNEFERGKNDPLELLHEAIWAAAFVAHPYHHPTIGWKEDIENVSIKRLKEFYDTFYWPNNATLTILGDMPLSPALALAMRHFGRIKHSPFAIPPMYTKEPPQEGRRHVELLRPGSTAIIGVAHKVPHGRHSDMHALQILAHVLNTGRSSRFHRHLVDRGLATETAVFDEAFHDPGLFVSYAYLRPGVPHAKVERLILGEYRSIARGDITDAEIKRAKAHVETGAAFARDGVFAESAALNEALALGDWTFYATYMERIEKVTKAEVAAVAQKYFRDDQMTSAYFKTMNSLKP